MSLLSGRFGQTAVTDDKLEELELGDEELMKGKYPFSFSVLFHLCTDYLSGLALYMRQGFCVW